MEPISAAIVNYNGAEYVGDCLEGVRRFGTDVAEVILVDSGSTDRSVSVAQAAHPGLRVVELGENGGPGRARNAAVDAAVHDRVLLIDNDVVLQPACVANLSAALDRYPSAVAAFATMRYRSDPGTVQFSSADPHFLGTCTLGDADVPLAELDTSTRVVGSAITSCILVDRARCSDWPLFDEAFFCYLEDHEFGLRSSLEGLQILAVPGAQCLHGLGTPGISIRRTGEFTPIRVRHTMLNRWQVILKLYQWRTLFALAPSFALFEMAQLVGAARKGWLGHWGWAVRELVRGFPDLLRRRRSFQAQRTRNDLEVLLGGPFPYNRATIAASVEDVGRRALDALSGFNWRMVGGKS